MNIHRICTDDGDVFAFEIDNAYITSRKIATLLIGVDQVSDLKVRTAFSSIDDVHVEFKFQQTEFMVWEPYGDNSRYWIGPKHNQEYVDISELEFIFEKYQPSWIFKIYGDLISCNFASLFGRPKKR